MSFEVIVRPAVFPDIRPAPARSLPPQDDPEKGFAVIQGNGGKHIDLSYSYSGSVSCSRPTETKRQVDEARVFQQRADGSVNRDNFIDINVANKIWMKGGSGPGVDNSGPGGSGPGAGTAEDETRIYHYRRIRPTTNIEILQNNKIISSG